MPFNENDYRDILEHTRRMLRKIGSGGMDERIISEIKYQEKPFYELIIYLKMLIDEIALGSDEQIKKVLRRVRNNVETDSGELVEGIAVQFTPEESERYKTKNLIFGPDQELQEIVSELKSVLNDLKEDHGW